MSFFIVLLLIAVNAATSYIIDTMIKPSTYTLDMGKVEHPVGDSLTVPDDTLSIREIINRFNSGQPLSDYRPDTIPNDLEDFDDGIDDEVIDPLTDVPRIAQEKENFYKSKKASILAAENSNRNNNGKDSSGTVNAEPGKEE